MLPHLFCISSSADEEAKAGGKFVVVEGFQLLATQESSALFDGVISIDLPSAECWSRRKARASAMAHLPPGFSTPEVFQATIQPTCALPV